MQALKLRVFQYRNLAPEEIRFSSGTNVFVGLNGQGKTNLLEALYFLAYGRSFRTSSPRECIRHGLDECRVQGTIEHRALVRELEVSVSRIEKKLLLYGKPLPIEEFVGNFHVLAFTHEHLNIVRAGPSERRAFLDRAMITLYPGHLRHLATYGRALKQRNRILASARESRRLDESLLRSWDEILVPEGARILLNRLQYVERIEQEMPAKLFGEEKLSMQYLSSVAGVSQTLSQIEEEFYRRLSEVRAQDERSGFTSVGPHRDELKLFIEGKPLAVFGSSGQQRSCLLSLYFAQMEIHRKENGFYPVFLVDDADAELDSQRLKVFLEYLSQRTQTFLTTARDTLLPSLPPESRRFEVRAGSVFPAS